MVTGSVTVVAVLMGRISVGIWELAGGVTVELTVTQETVVTEEIAIGIIMPVVGEASVRPMWDLITTRSPLVAVAAV